MSTTELNLQQTFSNTKASILALFDAIERLEIELTAADPIDPDAPCGYVPTSKALAYLASVRSVPSVSSAPSVDGLAGGSLPSSSAGDEGGSSSFPTPPPVAGKGEVRTVPTEGGDVTVENGEIIAAWCANCKRGGLPLRQAGRLYCICGHLIAENATALELRPWLSR
jgi:hypothetical protein